MQRIWKRRKNWKKTEENEKKTKGKNIERRTRVGMSKIV